MGSEDLKRKNREKTGAPVFPWLLVNPSFKSSYRILDKSERKRKKQYFSFITKLESYVYRKIIKSLMA